MHARTMVARVLAPCLNTLHAKRARALREVIEALLFGGQANLSAIALNLSRRCPFKHRLKCVDRLLGNVALQRSRSVTLYDEIHPQRRLAHPAVHRAFGRRLSHMIPSGCQVIVMTDAGFHAPWFKLVEKQGWGWLGGIRGRNRIRLGTNGSWEPARMLYDRAMLTAGDLGEGAYSRSNPVAARLVLAKRPDKGRHSLNIYGHKRIGRASAKNARAAREPWLLATSLNLRHLSAQAVVNLYAQRMRIEPSFRDTKNVRLGFGLSSSRCRSAPRLEMLLLLTHLAGFVQRLIGESARRQQLDLQFTATRRTSRPEISVLTLGRRLLIARSNIQVKLTIPTAMAEFRRQAQNAVAVAA